MHDDATFTLLARLYRRRPATRVPADHGRRAPMLRT